LASIADRLYLTLDDLETFDQAERTAEDLIGRRGQDDY
jgi:hypothetical protein